MIGDGGGAGETSHRFWGLGPSPFILRPLSLQCSLPIKESSIDDTGYILLMEEIRRSPVEVGSLSHCLMRFHTSQVVVWDFFHQHAYTRSSFFLSLTFPIPNCCQNLFRMCMSHDQTTEPYWQHLFGACSLWNGLELGRPLDSNNCMLKVESHMKSRSLWKVGSLKIQHQSKYRETKQDMKP